MRAGSRVSEPWLHSSDVGHRLIGSDRMHRSNGGGRYRQCIAVGSCNNRHESVSKLGVRPVYGRVRRLIKPFIFHITHNADNFCRYVVVFHDYGEFSADRILAGKINAGQRLVDQNNMPLLFHFRSFKQTTL